MYAPPGSADRSRGEARQHLCLYLYRNIYSYTYMFICIYISIDK